MAKIGYTDDANMAVVEDVEAAFMSSTFSLGVVTDLNDPEGRGRGRIADPRYGGDDEKTYTVWAEQAGFPMGSSDEKHKGDSGIWWLPVKGASVLVGNLDGNPNKPFYLHGPPFQADTGEKKAWIPKEAKDVSENIGIREGTRINVIKTEAGHSLVFNNNRGKESVIFTDRVGNVLSYSIVPSKGEDKKETKESKKSEIRESGETLNRGTNLAIDQTTLSPSAVLKNGVCYTGSCDINGNGVTFIAEQGNGTFIIKTSKANGDANAISVVGSTENNSMIFTVGGFQMILDGNLGMMTTTSTRIQEHVLKDMKPLLNKVKTEVANFIKTTFGKNKG